MWTKTNRSKTETSLKGMGLTLRPFPTSRFRNRTEVVRVLILVVTLAIGRTASAQLELPSCPAQEENLFCAPGVIERFDLDNTEFSWVNTYLMTILHKLAYADQVGLDGFDETNPSELAEYMRRVTEVLEGPTGGNAPHCPSGWGFTETTFFSDVETDTEGFIASNEDFAVVIFRGTEFDAGEESRDKDALTDAGAVSLEYDGDARVHAGFLRAARSVTGKIEDQLRSHHNFSAMRNWRVRMGRRFVNLRMRNPAADRPIWIGGNSLGGGVATLAAYELKTAHQLPVQGAYTSASPMVGNAAYAELYLEDADLALFRTVNNCDIVTQFPGAGVTWINELAIIAQRAVATMLANVPDVRGLVPSGVWPWLSRDLRDTILDVDDLTDDLQAVVLQAMQLGLAYDGDLASIADMFDAAEDFNFVHFGDLTYMWRRGRIWRNPSDQQVADDRIDTLARAAARALRERFVPDIDSPPRCWLRCPTQLAIWALEFGVEMDDWFDRVALGLLFPLVPAVEVGEALANELLMDHCLSAYTQRLWTRLRRDSINREGLPLP